MSYGADRWEVQDLETRRRVAIFDVLGDARWFAGLDEADGSEPTDADGNPLPSSRFRVWAWVDPATGAEYHETLDGGGIIDVDAAARDADALDAIAAALDGSRRPVREAPDDPLGDEARGILAAEGRAACGPAPSFESAEAAVMARVRASEARS